MNKKINRIKSAVLSGMIAVGSAVGSFAAMPMSASAAGAGDDYAKLLQYSLYFYDANMCGTNVGERANLSWRDDCHTSDEVDGGFHDAGDHVKFGLPAGYSASVLGLSYHEFGDAFDSTGQTAHLKTITDHFAEFFRNSTTLSGGSVTNFVYQVGDGDADHAEWCAPEDQGPSSRKTFSTTDGASDIAASYAAALAANYVNFGNEEDLTYAKALFDFSTKYNKCATDGPNNFYQSYDYYDDQAWAAGWLYLATNDSSYKSFLNEFMTSNGKGSSGQSGCQWGVYSTLSWNNVSMGAAILQSEITKSSEDWSKVNTYLDGHGANSDDYYFETQWGSARYNTAQQTAALISSKNGSKDYYSWAKGQMDYIMGNKGVGSASPQCFVVGLADNSSKYAHHRAASGYDNFDEFTNGGDGYSSDSHLLVGALCGGPTSQGGDYNDSIQDYIANEVTLDYNATLVAAAAGLYSKYQTGSPVDPTSIDGVTGGSGEVVTPPETTPTTASTEGSESNTTETTTESVQSTESTQSTQQTQQTQQTQPTQTTDSGSQGGNTPSGTDKEASFTQDGGKYMFNPENADTIEIEFTIDSNDTEGNGAIGFSMPNGDWEQVNYTMNISNGKGTAQISGEQLKGVTSAQLQIWWPTSATVEKINLKYNGSTNTTQSTQPTTESTQSTQPTTQGTQPTQPTTEGTQPTTQGTQPTQPTENTQPTQPSGDGLCGDANLDGQVTIADAVAILQYLANADEYPLSEQGAKNADCCNVGDGINTDDALAIQKLDAKVINSLPTN